MWVQIPPPAPDSYIVLRISYVVKNKTLPTTKEGFEAELSASREGKVSGANDSETGRFRRTSEARGEKKSHLRHQTRISYCVYRMS